MNDERFNLILAFLTHMNKFYCEFKKVKAARDHGPYPMDDIEDHNFSIETYDTWDSVDPDHLFVGLD